MKTTPKKQELTETEWRQVFDARCASKQGRGLTDWQRTLVALAYKINPERYAAMNADVFDATVPAGSTAKAKR